MAYTHITKEQRFKIQSWLELGMSQTAIAERLAKHRSSMSRELRLNSYSDGHYQAGHADKLARNRRQAGKRKSKKLVANWRLRRAVISRLKRHDSPEQITGQWQLQEQEYVVPTTIYQYLYTERPDLTPLLRQHHSRYRRRHGTSIREHQRELAKKIWITARPESINNRSELGHWEGDTIRGKGTSGSISTYVERVSGYALAHKLNNLTTQELHEKTVVQFQAVPKRKRLSTTNDNGVEFGDWEFTERVLGLKHYFALPYHSWERGTNENFNGLLRQFFPKGTSFATVAQRDVNNALKNLNHRPRKRLGYLTPYAVFVKGQRP